MSTRTTGKRNLFERCLDRRAGSTPTEHVRAELQRVARQVRKLDMKLINSPVVLRRDVLSLLKEAGR